MNSALCSGQHDQFRLVFTDAAGIAQPLPAELGPLPLYPLENGFYSVLGPPLSYPAQENPANRPTNHPLAYSPIDIPAALRRPRNRVFCGSSKCSGNSGPHTCARRSYTCQAPDCTRQTPFRTKQALNRHYEALHLAERIDCPVPGCENVGEKGIKRYDNLVAHMRNKHGVSQAGGSHGN